MRKDKSKCCVLIIKRQRMAFALLRDYIGILDKTKSNDICIKQNTSIFFISEIEIFKIYAVFQTSICLQIMSLLHIQITPNLCHAFFYITTYKICIPY